MENPLPNYRVDDLGAETIFHLVDACTPQEAIQAFEAQLYNAALGFTRTCCIGGWRGKREEVYCYRVASLAPEAARALIRWLLVNTSMKDIYVLHPDGIARGHCVEGAESETDTLYRELTSSPLSRAAHGVIDGVVAPDWQIALDTFHGMVRKPVSDSGRERLHGVRDTGWPHEAPAGRNRDLDLVVWAAKCHEHSQLTGLPLGTLAHTVGEVRAAINRVEAQYGRPAPSTDEGVKVRSRAT